MAKMTRSKLKGIVKECLVEILAEGIGSNETLNESAHRSKQKRQAAMQAENERLAQHRKSLDKKIEQTVTGLTNNSVMRDILADTARTTLQEQMSHDGGSPAGTSSGPGINLDNIFSESSQVWSELAFTGKKDS